MKEVTEWEGKPRWMWVWDDNENNKTKKYVVSILSEKETREANVLYHPVMVVGYYYKHCAEIEEETMKAMRLTDYEVSQLLKCFGVERRNVNGGFICNDVVYAPKGEDESKEVSKDCRIRYKNGEWEEPTRETVLKWCCIESQDSDIARFVSFVGWSIDKE